MQTNNIQIIICNIYFYNLIYNINLLTFSIMSYKINNNPIQFPSYARCKFGDNVNWNQNNPQVTVINKISDLNNIITTNGVNIITLNNAGYYTLTFNIRFTNARNTSREGPSVVMSFVNGFTTLLENVGSGSTDRRGHASTYTDTINGLSYPRILMPLRSDSGANAYDNRFCWKVSFYADAGTDLEMSLGWTNTTFIFSTDNASVIIQYIAPI
jgi:hypothetical protein